MAHSAAALLRVCALVVVVGCAQPLWDVEGLEARNPGLREVDGHRLGDTRPYALPRDGRLTFFLCRWSTDGSIPVSLPPDATADQTRILRSAVRAWGHAGLGLSFEYAGRPGEGIEIRFVAPGKRAAYTSSDCAVDETRIEKGGAQLPARLVFAAIHLSRGELDLIGREVPHTDEQLAGTALHELGHALGYQGHALRGDTVMGVSVDEVVRRGRRLLAGRRFRDATLRGLYALPSGTVVARVDVGRAGTGPVDRMRAIAQRRGFTGPIVRSGNRAGRIAWWDGEMRELAFMIYGYPEVLRSPDALLVHASPESATLLAQPGR